MKKLGKYEWSENYLLGQGYSKVDIDKYFHIEVDVVKKVKEEVLAKINNNHVKGYKCLILFGQPGCGKSTYMRNNNLNDYIVLDIDEFRLLYPFKDELLMLIEDNHKKNQNIPVENTKGRDFTNFTRKFVGVLVDELFNDCIGNGYNIAMQKHASDYKVFEDLFKTLKDNNYEINIALVLVSALVSWERCEKRNIINNMTLNTVSKDFHDGYVSMIPQTIIDIIDNYIIKENYVSKLEIVSGNENLCNNNSKIDYKQIKEYIEKELQMSDR